MVTTKRYSSIGWYVVLGILLIAGCIPRNQERRQLLGTWDIVHSERITIFEDGRTEVFEDLVDAGTLEIAEGGVTGLFTDYTLDYTNFEGTRVSLVGGLSIDEETSRILLYGFDCGGSIFNCARIMNVVKDARREQVWTYFYTDPPVQGQYDPTVHDVHFRWKLTLRKR